MTHKARQSVVACLLCLLMGITASSHAQRPGPQGGNPGAAGLGRPGGPGMSGGGFGHPPEAKNAPGQRSNRTQLPNSPPAGMPERAGGGQRPLPLNDVVSMVQSRFKAIVVKTDSVTQDGQLVYRIRLMSADKSKVWTVDVDSATGQIK